MTETGIVEIHGREYQTVARRIKDFRATHPAYRVITELISADDIQVVMKASILNEAGDVLATGYAEEIRGSGINKTSALENAETSAVGRALAFLGYGGSSIASADEMATAAQPITPEQVAILREHIDELDVDEPRFLAYLQADSLENIPAGRYKLALAAIERKRKAK